MDFDKVKIVSDPENKLEYNYSLLKDTFPCNFPVCKQSLARKIS